VGAFSGKILLILKKVKGEGKRNMKRLKGIIFAATSAVVGLALALPALPASAQSSAALSIVPKKNYTVEQGKTIRDRLTIRNLDTQKPLNLTLKIVDFTYRDDSGTPQLLLDEDEPQKTWSLKPYMTIPKTVNVPANQSKTIDLSLAVPKGKGAGSYYSAIVYSSGSPDGGNVGLNASGVSLVFANIPGQVKEDLKVEKFGAYMEKGQGQKPGYAFLTTDAPKQIAYTLKNDGNVTEAPVGSITLKSMWGQEYRIDDVNPNQSLALIGQSRTFVSCVKLKAQEVDFNGEKTNARTCDSPGLWPGYYGASLNLFYGQNGNSTKELNSTSGFWYLPLWFVILVVVLLIAIGVGIWLLVRKFKNRNANSKSKRSRR
jgi:hypothetical protein